MNCAEFHDIVHDLARDAGNGGMDQATRRSALAHSDSCARCDELLAESQSLTEALRSLAAKDAASAPGPQVEAALLDAFREKRVRATRAKHSWQWAVAGAASLAALVLFSVLVLRRPLVSPPSHGDVASTGTATQPTSGAPDANANASAADAVVSDADSEYATSFVPLPFADDSSPAEDEVIIRQSVSRAALADYGLPVSEAGANENLTADFVVDENGTPRAVRIVE